MLRFLSCFSIMVLLFCVASHTNAQSVYLRFDDIPGSSTVKTPDSVKLTDIDALSTGVSVTVNINPGSGVMLGSPQPGYMSFNMPYTADAQALKRLFFLGALST